AGPGGTARVRPAERRAGGTAAVAGRGAVRAVRRGADFGWRRVRARPRERPAVGARPEPARSPVRAAAGGAGGRAGGVWGRRAGPRRPRVIAPARSTADRRLGRLAAERRPRRR